MMMNNGYFYFPRPGNEPVLPYGPGSPERAALQNELKQLKSAPPDIPMYIGAEEARPGKALPIYAPHELSRVLGYYHKGGKKEVARAIAAALAARAGWAATSWEHRASVFLKAAELLSTRYRYLTNAATMLGQSKNVYQAEIDCVCELIDFFRFNVHFLSEIYAQQPYSPPGTDNRMEYRPLEGFVVAITPFNFTSIAGNLPTAPAMCGNVVVWKCADTQIFSAHYLMRLLKEAGLPDGVINLVYTDGPVLGETCFLHPDFAGLHFTGSTATFRHLWQTIGGNLQTYRTYPRIVGETGGKDFVVVHSSADVEAVVTALVRGAFEYSGQKCSAASRAYLPENLAPEIISRLVATTRELRMGPPEDFGNFINAVIDEKAFDKITGYIARAKKDPEARILAGGKYDKKKGYFIAPTVIQTTDPAYRTMREEIFGPVLTIYTYKTDKFPETLEMIDEHSSYGLTGAVFARDRYAIALATDKLVNCAGNFYINDKPTGAVVGQQPFGGARASGTNDKAGSPINLYRWLSARSIKETFLPPRDYGYPFMEPQTRSVRSSGSK
jgi:1-pyrroline-5-carboxylate dehydrogenase